MRNRKGFSLIELIVIIAIMAILTGVLTPLFVRYVNDRRERACRQNREAILNEYAKHVYADNGIRVNESDLNKVLAAAEGTDGIYNETIQQIKRYYECPAAGGNVHFYANMDGTKAYVVCAEHQDDACMLDFVGWIGTGDDDAEDIEYPVPPEEITTPSGQPPVSQDPEEETPPSSLNSVWPRKQDINGVEDERWSRARDENGNLINGLSNTAGVFLKLPKYAHFKDTLSGGEYVIVQGNGRTFQGSPAIFIKYEYAYGPDTIQSAGNNGDLTWVVKTSGRRYDNKNATPPGGASSFNLKKGDVYTYYFTGPDGKETSNSFIAAENTTVNLNGGDWFKATGTVEELYARGANSQMYYVPPLATSVDINDF